MFGRAEEEETGSPAAACASSAKSAKEQTRPGLRDLVGGRVAHVEVRAVHTEQLQGERDQRHHQNARVLHTERAHGGQHRPNAPAHRVSSDRHARLPRHKQRRVLQLRVRISHLANYFFVCLFLFVCCLFSCCCCCCFIFCLSYLSLSFRLLLVFLLFLSMANVFALNI